jgi:hypothetical protein
MRWEDSVKINLTVIHYRDVFSEMAQNRFQWYMLMFEALYILILLAEEQLVTYTPK